MVTRVQFQIGERGKMGGEWGISSKLINVNLTPTPLLQERGVRM